MDCPGFNLASSTRSGRSTIILLEVPSGALADTIGRKKLIVFAALCMVAEMLALLLAPDGWQRNRFFTLRP